MSSFVEAALDDKKSFRKAAGTNDIKTLKEILDRIDIDVNTCWNLVSSQMLVKI